MDKRKPKKFNGKGIAKMGNIVGNVMSESGEGLALLGQPELGVPLILSGKATKLGAGLLKKATQKKRSQKKKTQNKKKK